VDPSLTKKNGIQSRGNLISCGESKQPAAGEGPPVHRSLHSNLKTAKNKGKIHLVNLVQKGPEAINPPAGIDKNQGGPFQMDERPGLSKIAPRTRDINLLANQARGGNGWCQPTAGTEKRRRSSDENRTRCYFGGGKTTWVVKGKKGPGGQNFGGGGEKKSK